MVSGTGAILTKLALEIIFSCHYSRTYTQAPALIHLHNNFLLYISTLITELLVIEMPKILFRSLNTSITEHLKHLDNQTFGSVIETVLFASITKQLPR